MNTETNKDNSASETIQTLSERIAILEEQVQKLILLEKYIALQKKWDQSRIRITLNASGVYLVTVIFMHVLAIENPAVSALIPVFGYVITTISLPLVKKLWIKSYLKDSGKDNPLLK